MDLVAHTADGMIAVDREQRIVLWNQTAEMLLGFKAEEVLGRPCYEVLSCQDEAGHFSCQGSCFPLMGAVRREAVPTCDLMVRTKAGQEAWVNLSTFVVSSRRRVPFVLVHLFRDISRHRELERFAQQLSVSLEKLSRSRGSHLSIKQPSSPPGLP